MKERVYSVEHIENARKAAANGEDVLVERHCIECGDALLGNIDIEVQEVHCEEGHCYTRSGVSYVNSWH